jgi:hypothetical protein
MNTTNVLVTLFSLLVLGSAAAFVVFVILY